MRRNHLSTCIYLLTLYTERIKQILYGYVTVSHSTVIQYGNGSGTDVSYIYDYSRFFVTNLNSIIILIESLGITLFLTQKEPRPGTPLDIDQVKYSQTQ